MDKKNTYIIIAVVAIIIIGVFWLIIQNLSTNIEPGPVNQIIGGNSQPKAETKSETQVAKEMNGLRLTMDDNNQSMSMTPGKNLILMLGTEYTWKITSSDESVVGKNTEIKVTDNRIQGVYKALKAGNAVLAAAGTCIQGKTCAAPTASFKYTIDVVVSDNATIDDLVK